MEYIELEYKQRSINTRRDTILPTLWLGQDLGSCPLGDFEHLWGVGMELKWND